MDGPVLASPSGGPARPQHTRAKSASALRSILTSKSHKRSPSEISSSKQPQSCGNSGPYDPFSIPLLPPNHPHAGQRILGEIDNHSNTPPSPRKSKDTKDSRPKSLHKKTLSSVSLRSLGKEKEGERDGAAKEKHRSQEQKETQKPKKTKSSTSLSKMFSRSKSSKERSENTRPPKDKENATPPGSAVAAVHTPIWAEFSSQAFYEQTTTTNIPLNDQRTFDEEIALYTPANYSPSKQRNFHDFQQPTLQRRGAPAQRPKSAYLPSDVSSTSLIETLSRGISNESKDRPVSRRALSQDQKSTNGEQPRKTSFEEVFGRKPSPTDQCVKAAPPKEGLTVAKRGARVMAAVAAFNDKAKEAEIEPKHDLKKLDAEFEAVLDARNVPEMMRPKMRALTTRVKADFIKSHKVERSQKDIGSPSSFSLWNDTEANGLQADQVQSPVGAEQVSNILVENPVSSNSTKRERPRSKTFTWSKGDSSPSKKQRSDALTPSGRPKSIEISKSASSKSLSSMAAGTSAAILKKAPKCAVPEEFVTYLQKVQKPQIVEVGRLHKLRLLLRNETVEWVDVFIRLGGMTEIVGLLHRVMVVEWREEHEDNLLHEALLCLKGLCTTDLALQKLCEIEATLFPALLAMLFDQEHKGPSEFTTRQIIINLLFTHLSAATSTDLPARARTILIYLTDPRPPEDARPVPFILEMHQPRPYRIWCKEVVNVTKEVFWIFLHHLNVIPLPPSNSSDTTPPSSSSATAPSEHPSSSYTTTHFPRPRPPVPAAPYVGGVEWDATNYLSSHLDLLNGLLASLPSKPERNALRAELRASGFEKAMGGALRTCKEKFYGAVHDGLRTWVGAAVADGWEVGEVRTGRRGAEGEGEGVGVVRGQGSPKKVVGGPKKGEAPPRIEAPLGEGVELRLGLELERDGAGREGEGEGWI